MNIHNNDTYSRSVGQIPANQQSEQRMLLNAIKNKFASNNTNLSETIAPAFSIPSLKLPQYSSENQLESGKTQSKLNQFILGQLSESKTTTNNNGNFVIPNLQAPSKLNGETTTLAEKLHLKSVESEISIDILKNGIKDLQVRDDKKLPIIDLTTALNRQSIHNPSPSKQVILSSPNPLDFKIPFIDCDLKEATPQLPLRDEYCQLDVSGFVNSRYIAAPSKFGKITCLRYRLPKRLLCVHHNFNPKHEIIRFDFRSKSPDDIILSSLRKYNKV